MTAMVRAAESSDIPAIAAMEKELFSDAWSESMLRDCLSQSHYRISACEDGAGRLLGYLISTHVAGEAELLRIGVGGLSRRQGLGSMLMEQLKRLCGQLQTADVFLEVRASNSAAISLYERFGFASVGVRKNYYHDPLEDACLMSAQW